MLVERVNEIVLQPPIFNNPKPSKIAKFVQQLLDENRPVRFATPETHIKCMQALKTIEDAELYKKAVLFFRNSVGIPVSQDAMVHDIEFVRNGAVLFTCPKILLDAEPLRNMLTVMAVDKSSQIELDLSQEALLAYKRAIFGQKLDGISLEALLELCDFCDMIEDTTTLERIKLPIIDHYLDSNNSFNATHVARWSKEFTRRFLEKNRCNFTQDSQFSLTLDSFIHIFQGENHQVLDFVAQNIDAIHDVKSFSALHLIKARFRRAILWITIDIISIHDLRKIEQLIPLFPYARIVAKKIELVSQFDKDTLYLAMAAAYLCKSPVTALELCEKAAELNKTSTAVAKMGICLLYQNELDKAESKFKEALDLDPNNVLALSGMGQVLFEKEQFEEAEKYLKKLLELDPKFPGILSALGCCKKAQKKVCHALLYLEKALKYNPKSDLTLEHLSQCYLDLGEVKEAENLSRQALERNPKSALSLEILGTSLVKQNRLVEAKIYFRKLQEIDPAQGLAHLGKTLRLQKRFKEGIDCFLQAKKLDPNSWYVLESLGACYLAENLFDEAKTHFEKALEHRPESSFSRLGLCMSQLFTNDLKSAEDTYQKVNPLDFQNLAIELYEKGECAQAEKAIEFALKHHP